MLVDGAIGEDSGFYREFGFYVHGVGPETATLAPDWESRLVPVRNRNTRLCTGWCLDAHDLGASKLAAGREKDLEFVAALLNTVTCSPTGCGAWSKRCPSTARIGETSPMRGWRGLSELRGPRPRKRLLPVNARSRSRVYHAQAAGRRRGERAPALRS
jgi:hypothetical protein